MALCLCSFSNLRENRIHSSDIYTEPIKATTFHTFATKEQIHHSPTFYLIHCERNFQENFEEKVVKKI